MSAFIDPRGPKKSEGYQPGYEGLVSDDLITERLWAVGATPEDAVRALCKARWNGDLEGDLRPLEGGDPGLTWGCRFTSKGVHFKAAGIHLPGGVALTWWV